MGNPTKADWEGDGKFLFGRVLWKSLMIFDKTSSMKNSSRKLVLDPDIMPDFFSCEEVIGSITEAAAEETGLVAGIPVAARFG